MAAPLTVEEAVRQAAERDGRARMAFMQADTDGSGTIDPHEYLRVMASIGVYAHLGSEAEMLEAAGKDFAAANTSGSGELNVYEFMSFYQHLEAHMRGVHERRARAVAAFHHFDADASGSIDRHEFRAALCALGVVRALSADASAAKIDAEFARIDTDRSGSLCVDEFVRFYLEAEEKAAADAARDGAALAKFAELAQGAAFIEKDKFWHALLGLGLFHGLTVEQAVDKVNEQFPLADVDGSGVLDADEFCRYVRLMEGVQSSRRNSGRLGSVHGSPSPSSSPAKTPSFMAAFSSSMAE